MDSQGSLDVLADVEDDQQRLQEVMDVVVANEENSLNLTNHNATYKGDTKKQIIEA